MAVEINLSTESPKTSAFFPRSLSNWPVEYSGSNTRQRVWYRRGRQKRLNRGLFTGYAIQPYLRWLPSQKGLFLLFPQRQSVTRLRISYVVPFADSIGIPPLTHIGPILPGWVSTTRPMEGSNFGSNGFPPLSQATSLPEGQSQASSMALRLAPGSLDCLVSSQVPPERWQKRAVAQKPSASVNRNPGPSISMA